MWGLDKNKEGTDGEGNYLLKVPMFILNYIIHYILLVLYNPAKKQQ
jgi:hypothetical protein